MVSFFTDISRALRLFKLLRSTDLSDEDALRIEKIDTIYLAECRAVNRSLEKTRKSLNRALKSWKTTNGEQLAELENSLIGSVQSISQLLDASQKALSDRLGNVEQSSQTTMELVDNVREFVAKQADETRRWQEGYDWRILKNYLLRVISTVDDVENQLSHLKQSGAPEKIIKKFDFLRETLEIHLEEEGLISFSPDLGKKPDTAKEEIKASVVSETEQQAFGMIAEVIRRGYEIDLGSGTKVVRKAQVTVYKK